MATRREFVVGTTAAAATVMSGTAHLSAAPLSKLRPFYRAIADRRSSASVAFAAEAEVLGHEVALFDGDITGLWANNLRSRWAQSPAAIFGLTEHGPLFCLERWGWEVGMRVVFRGVHYHRQDGVIDHHLDASDLLAGGERSLRKAACGYPTLLARMMSRDPASGFRATATLPDSQFPLSHAPLVSWIISPPIAPVHVMEMS